MNKVYDFIIRNEKWLYFIFLAICFFHIWATRYVPSLDGPQHLYNAQVLAELLRGNDLFKTFFKLNPVIVGYWSGHFFLTLFKLFLPGWLAEKFFLISYVVAAALSFRYLVRGLFPDRQNLLVFLIFPFIFHSYLVLGYYSFSIAAIFYFWAFGYWVRHYENFHWREMFVFGLLSLAIFLSHGLVFVFFAFSFLLYFIVTSTGSLLAPGGKMQFQVIFYRAWRVALSLIPAIVLCIVYYISVMGIQSGIAEAAYSKKELVGFIFRIRQLVGFHHELESPAFRVLFVLIAILCVAVARDFFRKIRRKEVRWKDLLNLQYSWIFITLFFLAAYFFMPDRISAGNLTNRFGLYFFLALIIFLSALKVPRWLQLLTVVVLIGVMLQTMRVQYSFLKRLTEEMMEIRELIPFIEDGTTMAGVNTSDNWIQGHFQLYAAIDREVVHLDNPQCRGQFPVIWNQKDLPECFTGSERYWPSGAPDVTGLGHRQLQVDYITVFYYNRFLESDDYEQWKNILGEYYTLVKVSSHQRAALFKHMETGDKGSP